MLSGIGKDAGATAADRIADTVDKAVPEITGAAEHISGDLQKALQSAIEGIADGVGQIVGIASRIDGATLHISGIEISIKIANPSVTVNLGPYKPE